jgi:hypothetical protein
MKQTTYETAAQVIRESIAVRRDDIARAKVAILGMQTDETVKALASNWIAVQKIHEVKTIDLSDVEIAGTHRQVARDISLRQAFYNAAFELTGTAEIVMIGTANREEASIGYKSNGYSGGLPDVFVHYYPVRIARLSASEGFTSDVDIVLSDIDAVALHQGVREGIVQSLECFRRGLYMPATVMLAAAVEAAWTECGIAVATHLNSTKLKDQFDNPRVSISQKIVESVKVFEQPDGKTLLKAASQSESMLREAQVWTNVLRHRRNAVHWGKARCFSADHSETASLLMAAKNYIELLESIRQAC